MLPFRWTRSINTHCQVDQEYKYSLLSQMDQEYKYSLPGGLGVSILPVRWTRRINTPCQVDKEDKYSLPGGQRG